ncbi:Rcf2 protein [Saccharomycopsis crataegensis]|uniref:Rcf2 protein n=1 Tax=Saccharomycopsis crataegensis TaxID=43959 RepID=A0AAV5QNE9_9ASCO|nr:Rcf2 protein [Saccharomycopsis crataegensis]
MKLLNEEEISAHNEALFIGGFKGALGGLAVSTLIFTLGKQRFPAIGRLPIAFKTALKIAPPTFGISVMAELSSQDFDRKMYHDDPRIVERHLQELRRWKSLSWNDKFVESLSNHKYKVIVGAWAASLYGSWALVNRDPIMTQTQKLVQARVYAQFLTVGLLLGSIGLSVHEENLEKSRNIKKQSKDVDDTWKDIVEDEEKAELARGESLRLSADELGYAVKAKKATNN